MSPRSLRPLPCQGGDRREAPLPGLLGGHSLRRRFFDHEARLLRQAL